MYAPGHLFAIRGGKQCMHLDMSLPSEVGSNVCTWTCLCHQRWEAMYAPGHVFANFHYMQFQYKIVPKRHMPVVEMF